MPSAFPASVAEREAELIALQSAFDEYIASSRELEEELDAELAKMQQKLAESTAANSALSAQLENIAPQLASLEMSLSESRRKLKDEQKLRRAAEQGQDEADQRVREMEQSLQQVREECDELHEQLAFGENELEEARLELEVEKQQLQNELSKAKAALERAAAQDHSSMAIGTDGGSDVAAAPVATKSMMEEDEAYVRKLEEELELVTEQLIEMEKRLTDTESELQAKTAHLQALEVANGRREEDEELIQTLQAENADHLDLGQRLRDEVTALTEELAITKEELALQREELQAAEEDYKATKMALEEEKVRHQEQVSNLAIEVKQAEIKTKESLGEAAMVAAVVKESSDEIERLLDQVESLENALMNAKKDYQNVLDELEEVNARFDEVREEARREAQEITAEEVWAAMKSDTEHEINMVKEQLAKLAEENKLLQEKVDYTEVAVAAAKDMQNGASDAGANELVRELQAQLARAKEDLAKKQKEMEVLTTTMENRLGKAEENVTNLEKQLLVTKGKLAEAEANIIVLKHEKDRKEIAPKASKTPSSCALSASSASLSRRSRSMDREELSTMSTTPAPKKSRGRRKSRSSSPVSVMRLEYRLAEEAQKFEDLQKQYDSLQDQKRMGEIRIKRLEEDIRFLQKQVFASGGNGAVATKMSRLSSLAASNNGMDVMAENELDGSRIDKIIDSRDLKAMAAELRSLDKKCNSQREYNAQLLSKMLHLQGNIQVYCRVRPMSLNEIEKGYQTVADALSETELGCFDSRTNKWKSFVFDRVWGPDQSQQSIFQDVEPLALSVVDGFNACIFAYGQTGSGKTFTMEGVRENNQYGISYRTIQKIFHLLNLRAQQQRAQEIFVGETKDDGPAERVSFEFSINVGMLEIYNDEIYDLLNTEGASMEEKKQGAMRAGGKMSLDIRRDKDGRIEVPNLTKESVTSIEEVMEILKRGNSNRATATTDMNEHSSRSHMVLMVDVASGVGGEAQSNRGTLYLVDLAGCERVRKSNVQGDQLKEAGHINKSLSALGNVMEALDRKASHVPYRDSKLTYMLQDSLGGNSRTMMVVTICPNDDSYDESVHALQFATRVRRIQIGAAQRNVTSKNLEETVKSLTEEMRALARAKERSESQLHALKRDNTRVQEKLQKLNTSRAQSKTDSKTLDVLRKNNDDMAARWQKEKAAREEANEELEKSRKELRAVQQKLSVAETNMKGIEQKLEAKDRELDRASDQLRQVRNDRSAATVRARRDEVLGARTRHPVQSSTVSSPAPTPSAPQVNGHEKSHSSTTSAGSDQEVAEVREKVLELLKKHDAIKVDRLDIIMEKFKGRESLLLEKMTQRYEGTSASSSSLVDRNALSVQRHQERMKRIREKNAAAGK